MKMVGLTNTEQIYSKKQLKRCSVDINYRKVFQPERVQQAASIAQQRRNKHSEKSESTLENIFMQKRIKPHPHRIRYLIIKLMHLIWIVNTVFLVVQFYS